jgi:galactitol PTS system EIIC component
MRILNEIVNLILSFKPYVMLPILMLIVSLVVRIRFLKALKAAITLGIGFIGIFIVFDYFVGKIGPVIELIVADTGLSFNVLDVGWPPMAAIAWSFRLAPILIIIIMAVNLIMLALKWTTTVNIDIWNFWHFIFTAQLVFSATNNILLAVSAAITASIITVKLGDWSAGRVEELSGISGVSITTLSGVAYYPFTLMINKLLDSMPIIKDLKADPENIKNKLGFFGESMFIGFVMGLILGISGKYDVKNTLELAFSISAVVFILPKMSGILGEGLMPISEGMKQYMLKKFPHMKNTYIGLDLAIIVGNPAVVVTGILLMPAALILAFVLPGIRFIPIGDLPNMIGAVAMVVVATRGNIVRAFIAGIPVIIGKLYIASSLAGVYTELARAADFQITGYNGMVTSFLDGGNVMRFWLMRLFSGSLIAIIFVPIAIYFLYIARKSGMVQNLSTKRKNFRDGF